MFYGYLFDMEENIRIQLVEMNRLIKYDRSKTLLEQEPSLDRMVGWNSMGTDRYNEYQKIQSISDMDIEQFLDLQLDATAIFLGTVGSTPLTWELRLAGFAVDVLHILSYIYRAHISKDSVDKTFYWIQAILTLLTTMWPYGRTGIRAWIVHQKRLLTHRVFKLFFKNIPEESIFLILFAIRFSREGAQDLILDLNKKIVKLYEHTKKFPIEGDLKDKLIESCESAIFTIESALRGLDEAMKNPEFTKLINDDGEIILDDELPEKEPSTTSGIDGVGRPLKN